jgi:cold shock CspA family protein
MTGRIRSLSPGNGAGLIAADNGISAHFVFSEVIEYDVACLAAGQTVTFDLDGGSVPMAVNICVQRQHRRPLSPARQQESVPLRYIGFRQSGCVREYRFERLRSGEPAETLVVAADLGLFRKHRIGIQEGPRLCLRALESEPASAGLRYTLTDRHMLAYLASRPAPRPRPRHVPPPRRAAAG